MDTVGIRIVAGSPADLPNGAYGVGELNDECVRAVHVGDAPRSTDWLQVVPTSGRKRSGGQAWKAPLPPGRSKDLRPADQCEESPIWSLSRPLLRKPVGRMRCTRRRHRSPEGCRRLASDTAAGGSKAREGA